MSDDMLLHFSSNSSKQSDNSLPDKIAKLEARLVGKGSGSLSASAHSARVSASSAKVVDAECLAHTSTSSDSDGDNGEEFLIQAHTQKRKKINDDNSSVNDLVEVVVDGKQKILDNMTTNSAIDFGKKKQGCGRGQCSAGRGRGHGSKVNDQTKTQSSPSTVSPSNGQHETLYHKVNKWLLPFCLAMEE